LAQFDETLPFERSGKSGELGGRKLFQLTSIFGTNAELLCGGDRVDGKPLSQFVVGVEPCQQSLRGA
jgi:hypothetical protein